MLLTSMSESWWAQGGFFSVTVPCYSKVKRSVWHWILAMTPLVCHVLTWNPIVTFQNKKQLAWPRLAYLFEAEYPLAKANLKLWFSFSLPPWKRIPSSWRLEIDGNWSMIGWEWHNMTPHDTTKSVLACRAESAIPEMERGGRCSKIPTLHVRPLNWTNRFQQQITSMFPLAMFITLHFWACSQTLGTLTGHETWVVLPIAPPKTPAGATAIRNARSVDEH